MTEAKQETMVQVEVHAGPDYGLSLTITMRGGEHDGRSARAHYGPEDKALVDDLIESMQRARRDAWEDGRKPWLW